METKEVRIQAPEGWIIDTHTSNGKEVIVTYKENKPKGITWEDINRLAPINSHIDTLTLQTARSSYYTKGSTIDIINMHNYIIAYSKLVVIAKYLNGDWKPKLDLSNYKLGTSIAKTPNGYVPLSWECSVPYAGVIIFKNKQSCEDAIRIMGDELDYLFK